MTSRCPACGSTQPHGDSNTVVAGSRFQPGSQPYAYRALGVADAPSRATREEALADWLAHHRETAT